MNEFKQGHLSVIERNESVIIMVLSFKKLRA